MGRLGAPHTHVRGTAVLGANLALLPLEQVKGSQTDREAGTRTDRGAPSTLMPQHRHGMGDKIRLSASSTGTLSAPQKSHQQYRRINKRCNKERRARSLQPQQVIKKKNEREAITW